MIPMYMKDCYLKEFDTHVKAVEGEYVELEDTIFYPRSGGQPCDHGTINDVAVEEVVKRDGRILHKVNGTFGVGETVHCKIDWERRYTFMRYHTAAHILSAVIHKETGALITGNQISLDKTRIDFNLPEFDKAKIAEWEKRANEIISEGHEVKTSVLPREEAFKIPDLVKLKKLLPESIKDIRIVEIVGVDIQACGGTHVKNTKEIGGIKIIKTENKGKNNRRIYFSLA